MSTITTEICCTRTTVLTARRSLVNPVVYPNFWEALVGAYSTPFMARALLVVLVLAVLSGVVGVLINLRGQEFVSDGLSHAVFPGLAVGLLLGGTAGVIPGALAGALIGAAILALLTHWKVASDAATAMMFTALFSFGVIVVSRGDSYSGDLEGLLFGRVLTIPVASIVPFTIVCAVATIALLVTLKAQVIVAVDGNLSRISGVRTIFVDLILISAIAFAVVAAAATMGALLVLAFLIVPGAAARLATRRLWTLFPIAVVFSALAGWIGLSTGYALSVYGGFNVPPGAVVALVFVLGYLVILVISMLFRRFDSRVTRYKSEVAPDARQYDLVPSIPINGGAN